MVNHPNRSKQQRKLSDMSGYEADDVMVVELEEYEALKTLNAELLAALKAWQVFARAKPSENDTSMGATISIKDFNAAQELTRAIIAKAERR